MFTALGVSIALLALAASVFGIVALFVAWKPAGEIGGQKAAPVFRPGLLHTAAAANLALCVIHLVAANAVRDQDVSFLYAFLHGCIAGIVYLASAVKPSEGTEVSLQTLLIWGLRALAALFVLALLYSFVSAFRDGLRQRDLLRQWHPGQLGFWRDLRHVMQAGQAGGRGAYELAEQVELVRRPEGVNVHREWERTHGRYTVRIMDAISEYLSRPKTSEEWAEELGFPFNPSPLSNLHTPVLLIQQASQVQKMNVIFEGLRAILQGHDALPLLDDNIRYSFMNSRIAPDKARAALLALLVMYNEADINTDWAAGVVRDAAQAYGRGDRRENVSCADGVAERMVLDFIQVVRSKCVAEPGQMSEKLRAVCDSVQTLERTAAVESLTPRNLNDALGTWLRLEDAHYADKEPRTRRADLIRYMVDFYAPNERDEAGRAEFEQRITEALRQEGILDGPRSIDFTQPDKESAVEAMGE
jgi:hypothetical protein